MNRDGDTSPQAVTKPDSLGFAEKSTSGKVGFSFFWRNRWAYSWSSSILPLVWCRPGLQAEFNCNQVSLTVATDGAAIQYAVHHGLAESVSERPCRDTFPSCIELILCSLEFFVFEMFHFDQRVITRVKLTQKRKNINISFVDIISISL
jgi:hypothetical protein